MKITSGEFKYRTIDVPKGIRPTTEKVREAVFSMVGEWIPSGIVIDLFAGSGAMGLEAISRGSSKCYFCESNRQNYRILLSNIANCRAEERAVAFNCDFRSAIGRITEKVDIVILDPPYEITEYYKEAFDMIGNGNVLSEGGIVIAEYNYNNQLSDTYGMLSRIKKKKYGTIGVDVYIYR